MGNRSGDGGSQSIRLRTVEMIRGVCVLCCKLCIIGLLADAFILLQSLIAIIIFPIFHLIHFLQLIPTIQLFIHE